MRADNREDESTLALNKRLRTKYEHNENKFKTGMNQRGPLVRKSEEDIMAAVNGTEFSGAVKVVHKMVLQRDPKWLAANRIAVTNLAQQRELENRGWKVRSRGKNTYAYSNEYVSLNRTLRREMFHRVPIEVRYKGRMAPLDVPLVKPGFTTSAVLTENWTIIQVFNPVTGPDNQYPAWLRRYIDTTKRDVTFYDIGVVKLPGARRASRAAIYKEDGRFVVFVPVRNEKLTRTSSKREPMTISEEDAHTAVVRYRKMASKAREMLRGRESELPHFIPEKDGGYPQIGYITFWDETTSAPTVKPLYGVVSGGRTIMYVNVSLFERAVDNKTGKAVTKRMLKRMLIERGYSGGVYNDYTSRIVLVQDGRLIAYDPANETVPQATTTFQTSVSQRYDTSTMSPGRTIDHTMGVHIARTMGIIDMSTMDADNRRKNIGDTFYHPHPAVNTHADLVDALRSIHNTNARMAPEAKREAAAARAEIAARAEAAAVRSKKTKPRKPRASDAKAEKVAKKASEDAESYSLPLPTAPPFPEDSPLSPQSPPPSPQRLSMTTVKREPIDYDTLAARVAGLGAAGVSLLGMRLANDPMGKRPLPKSGHESPVNAQISQLLDQLSADEIAFLASEFKKQKAASQKPKRAAKTTDIKTEFQSESDPEVNEPPPSLYPNLEALRRDQK
jgi:hypothetical protein